MSVFPSAPGINKTSMTTSVRVLLATLENERHARGALLVAFIEELHAAFADRAPDSTRALLQRAATGDIDDVADTDFLVLLDELRARVREAA